MKEITSVFIIIILSIKIYSQSSASITQNENKNKALKLCIEIPAKFLTDSNYAGLLQLTKEKVLKYNIDEIRVGGNYHDCIKLPDFPLVKTFDRKDLIIKLRSELQWFKKNGIKITLYMGGEPSFTCNVRPSPDSNSFLDLYPEARFLDNGMLWKFLEERTFLLFQLIPEADGFSYHLWETPLLDDINYFTGLRWQKDNQWYLGLNQYYSLSDYITEMIAAYSLGADKAGKEMAVLSFCHYPHQENLLLESFKELEKRNTPMTLIHKSQPGDWDPYRGPNNVMLNTHSKSLILFDGVGEYWGGSRIPYCFPEEIQYRLINALDNNKNIESVGMRVFDYFDDGNLFENYNDINFFACYKYSINPQTSVEEIWKEWANMRFGEKAAPKIIEALKRTDDVGKKIYYFRGIWVQQHSQIASLDYMEAQVLHTGRAMLTWYDENITDNGLIEDFMYHPTEEIIKIAVNDRKDALGMCNQSIQDVESVRDLLQKDEYQKLIGQLNVQKKFTEITILHIEAFLRYKMYKNNPDQENYSKLQQVLSGLEKLSKEINAVYKKSERLLLGDRILNYVNEIKNAL